MTVDSDTNRWRACGPCSAWSSRRPRCGCGCPARRTCPPWPRPHATSPGRASPGCRCRGCTTTPPPWSASSCSGTGARSPTGGLKAGTCFSSSSPAASRSACRTCGPTTSPGAGPSAPAHGSPAAGRAAATAPRHVPRSCSSPSVTSARSKRTPSTWTATARPSGSPASSVTPYGQHAVYRDDAARVTEYRLCLDRRAWEATARRDGITVNGLGPCAPLFGLASPGTAEAPGTLPGDEWDQR